MFHLAMQRIITTAFFLLYATTAIAQGYRGRDFWVCFPENAAIEGNKTLHLSLFITAEARTKGTIVNMLDSSRRSFSVETDASTEVDIDTEIEIRSSELAESKSLHITSDHDITLYVVSHRPASTDSYAAIPTSLLGTHYMAAGYTMLQNGPEAFTSQAATIATEDNTLVTVHLTATIGDGIWHAHSKGQTAIIPLNRGQTFQIQGAEIYTDNDLTGTAFTSDKPVAFFTGHRCATIPSGYSFCDMLLEMEPPEIDWGREFILAKFQEKDFYVARVIAASDSTDVSIDGQHAATLASGAFYEIDTLHNDALLTTSKPALVAQYATSSNADSVKVGDPFMLFVIPSDRFIRTVTTASVTVGAFRHFLNIVLPTAALPSLRLDGLRVNAKNSLRWMKPVRENIAPGGSYSILTFEAPEGRHLLQCSAPMAVYSYGFGERGSNYDSYGHACGMRLGK